MTFNPVLFGLHPPLLRWTGHERVPDESLILAREEFSDVVRGYRDPKIHNWRSFLQRHDTEEFEGPFDTLRSHINGRAVLELGAGKYSGENEKIFRGVLHVGSYAAVDNDQELAGHSCMSTSDMLTYLRDQPSNSANVAAFGVLNEPLIPHAYKVSAKPSINNLKHIGRREYKVHEEYARRVLDEIIRVVPKGGVLFGVGLDPYGKPFVRDYLQRCGLTQDKYWNYYFSKGQASNVLVYDERPFLYIKP